MQTSKEKDDELTLGGLRKRRREMIQRQFGYTDTTNPFNDPELSKPFVWTKKLEKTLGGTDERLESRRYAAEAAAREELHRVEREERERSQRRRISSPSGARDDQDLRRRRSVSPIRERRREDDERPATEFRARGRELSYDVEEGDGRRRRQQPWGYGERHSDFDMSRREEVPSPRWAPRRDEEEATRPMIVTAKDYLKQTERKMGEIETVKARREARKIEEAMLEEHRRRVAQERESQAYGEWKIAESEFVRNVAKLRSRLRIEQQREDVVDFWLKELDLSRGFEYANMSLLPGSVEEMAARLDDAKLQQVIGDLRVRIRVDKQDLEDAKRKEADAREGSAKETDPTLDTEVALQQYSVEDLSTAVKYWEAVRTIVEAEAAQRGGAAGGRIVPFVETQLKQTLVSKTPAELEEMSAQVEAILKDPTPDVDIDYWELVKAKLPLYRAMGICARVRQLAQATVPEGTLWAKLPSAATKTTAPKVGARRRLLGPSEREELAGGNEYPEHYWSPKLLDGNEPLDLGADEDVPTQELTEEDDDEIDWSAVDHEALDQEQAEQIEASRKLAGETRRLREGHEGAGELKEAAAIFERFIKREKQIAPPDEMILEGDEVQLMPKYGPSDPYLPRKPRYFNRVKTGYEWNRYNQTHYDQENPPPRVVQGYKFCIAYPHLLDPLKTPHWRIEPSGNNDDSVILRFIGGPPYEDLAFRIVNRAWDLNTKKGFRNTFDQGILQLHFNFKRRRYRK